MHVVSTHNSPPALVVAGGQVVADPAPGVRKLFDDVAAAFERARRRFILTPPQLKTAQMRAKQIAVRMPQNEAIKYLETIAIPAFQRVAELPGAGPGNTLTELRMDYFCIEPPSRVRAW